MKRLAVLLGIALLAFSSSAVAVAATGTTKLTGTSEWSGGTFENPTITNTVHGTFAGRLGKGTYEGTLTGGPIFETSDCGPACELVTGSITFSSNRGSFTGVVQPGSYVVLIDSSTYSLRGFTLTLSVVDGTRSYAHADGLLTLTYESEWHHYFDTFLLQDVNYVADAGTLTGTLH